MGRGNCMVSGDYEGLWYIDRDLIDVYWNRNTEEYQLMGEIGYNEFMNCEYSEEESEYNFNDMLEIIRDRMMLKYNSFVATDRWISDGGSRCDRRAFAENELFFIAVEDNEWSYAIELIQKGPESLAGLQKRLYETYLNSLRDIILDVYGEVSYRNGPWMHGTIHKEDVAV